MIGTRFRSLREATLKDDNLSRFFELTRVYLPKLPKASAKYLAAKVPVVQWSPKYSLSWLWNDLVAGKTYSRSSSQLQPLNKVGITIGILLVPQSLAYAKVANIPARYGLISSWLPTLIYAIMGTSKGEITVICPFVETAWSNTDRTLHRCHRGPNSHYGSSHRGNCD